MILDGGTIRLRPLTLDDADAWLAGEDDVMARGFEFPRRSTIDDVVGAINGWIESWRHEGGVRKWAICDAATGVIAGGVELRPLAPGEVNLSYEIFPPWRRRGFAAKAAALALDYAAATMGITRAKIKVLTDNHASLGVARRLGAEYVGTEPSDRGATFAVFRCTLLRR